jgi:hypothetical protein
MKNKTQQINGLIDVALFAGFVLACFLDLTGLAIHQWLGIALGALGLYHLWRHQAWVAATGRRWLSGLAGRPRLYALLDLAIGVGMGAIIVTGVIMSSWLNLALANYATWRLWHVALTATTLGLLVAKLGLHWRWIVQTLRGRRPAQTAPAAAPVTSVTAAMPLKTAPAARAAAPAGTMTRRDFLQVMGLVSVAAVLAGTRIIGSQTSAAAATTTASSAAKTTSTTASTTTSSTTTTTTSATSSCQVLCNRKCSYPGQCRRYVDTNGNGRCDRGECS